MLPIARSRILVSTLPAADVNAVLLHGLADAGFAGQVVLTAYDRAAAARYEAAGVALILNPFRDAGRSATDRLLALARASTPHADRS